MTKERNMVMILSSLVHKLRFHLWLQNFAKLFSPSVRVSQSLHFFRITPSPPCALGIIIAWLLVIATLTGVEVIPFTGALIHSLMNGYVEHHVMAYLPFACLVWKQFYLGSLSTFSRVICIFCHWVAWVPCIFSPIPQVAFSFSWWAKFLCHVLSHNFFWH